MEKIHLITSDRREALGMLERTAQEPHKGDVRMLEIGGMYVVYDYRLARRGLPDLSHLTKIKPSIMESSINPKQDYDYRIRV